MVHLPFCIAWHNTHSERFHLLSLGSRVDLRLIRCIMPEAIRKLPMKEVTLPYPGANRTLLF